MYRFIALQSPRLTSPRNLAAEMRRKASREFLVLQSLGMMCAICFAYAAFTQSRYQITRIPTAQGANCAALGINNKGEVVGYSFQGEDYQAFLYASSDGSLTDVGSFGGKINAACAINDAGQVTGYSQDENGNFMAFVFKKPPDCIPRHAGRRLNERSIWD
jgi:probable HAF family extracellular repeat protein